MFGSKRVFLTISISCLTACILFACAPRYQYRTLAPVKQDVRQATDAFETVKKGSVAFKLYKSNFADLRDDIAKIAGSPKAASQKLKTVKSEKYTIFKLVIEKKTDDVVQIDPAGIKALVLAEYEEKESLPIQGVDEVVDRDILAKSKINITGEGPKDIYIIFPYRLNEEHMAKIQLSSIKVNDEDFSTEFPFHGTDTWEGRKRAAQYTGMGLGAIAVIAGVVMFLN